MRALCAVAVLGGVLTAQTARAPINGKWRGTFYAMPDPSHNQNRERRFQLELTIAANNRRLTGTFTNVTARTQPFRISKGECRRDLCCFETADDPAEGRDVNTWCVSPKGDSLDGIRNGGEMTKDGPGIGARFFRVIGRRVR